jgi:hypothetical protein
VSGEWSRSASLGVYDQVTLGAAGALAGDQVTGVAANGNCCLAPAKPVLPQYNSARTLEAWVKPAGMQALPKRT